MKYSKSQQNQTADMYKELIEISQSSADNEMGKNDEGSYISSKFSLSSSSGKKLYKSLYDEELLSIINEIAKEIGHPPSQREVFWVWREYIKLRFKKWPYALTAAGLPKYAGSGGVTLEKAQENSRHQEQLLSIVREKAKALGRIPHPKDLPEVSKKLNKYMHRWQDVIKAAGIDHKFFLENSSYIISDLEEEYKQYLQEIRNQTIILGRAPRRNEVDPIIKEKLTKRCGTWRNVLYQIGLEPIMRIQPFSSMYTDHPQTERKQHHQNTLYDCYYRVLNLDEQSINALIFIKELESKLQREPEKNEVPADIRIRLQRSCGSWANALYQIQYV